MTERHESGVLDTSAYIDLALLNPAVLPTVPELTAIAMAELHQGVATAKDATSRAARTEKLAAAIAEFEPLPFDGSAAARYGTLVALTVEANRGPKPGAWICRRQHLRDAFAQAAAELRADSAT